MSTDKVITQIATEKIFFFGEPTAEEKAAEWQPFYLVDNNVH
jgi:hypothetical protein